MVDLEVKEVERDPNFKIIRWTLSNAQGGLELTLEVPQGLMELNKGDRVTLELSQEEREGDLVMKGIVHRIDEKDRRIEISFHGLWLLATYRRNIPFNLREGDKVYLSLSR